MLVVCLTGSWRPVHADNGNHFWEWGVGQYQETHGDITLDDARWDWLVVGWINNGLATQAAWDHINACLAMNPNLKLVIELDLQWCEFGNPERYAGAATMFDYYFDSQYHDHQSAKTGIEQTLHDRIAFAMLKCAYPKRIVGLALVEEMPGNWGCGDQIAWADKPAVMPAILTEFQTRIEDARGLAHDTLHWDKDTQLWVGQVFAKTLHTLHTLLRQDLRKHPEAPNAKVIYWHQYGYAGTDEIGTVCYPPGTPCYPVGTPLCQNGMYPVSFADIVPAGLVDVVIGQPTHPFHVARMVRIADTYHVLYFWQVSHPSAMRLVSWADAITNASTDDLGANGHPLHHNLGYFFYCEGGCNSQTEHPNLRDPSFGSEAAENVTGASTADHARRYGAQHHVGMSVVRKVLAPTPFVQVTWRGRAAGAVVPLTVLLQHPATPDWFTSADQAEARNVVMTLTLPKQCHIATPAQQSLSVHLGNIPPLSWKKYTWQVKIDATPAPGTAPVVTIRITSANWPAVQKTITGDSTIPAFL